MPKKFEPAEISFYRPLIEQYLKFGSVDEVFLKSGFTTGISYPHFHRILDQWGIVKSAGPNSRLSEALFFMAHLVRQQLPLEAIYRLLPTRLKVSKATLHRIVEAVRKGLHRRQGTALLLSFSDRPGEVVIGSDQSVARPELGKHLGDLSLPMTFYKKGETAKTKITRTLQQEVFSNLALDRISLESLISVNTNLSFKIYIADVLVDVYEIEIDSKYRKFLSSPKLSNLHLEPVNQIAAANPLESHYRSGVPEIAKISLKEITKREEVYFSELNRQVALLAVESSL